MYIVYSKAVLTWFVIRFYPFSFWFVLPVHIALGKYENATKTTKRLHCPATGWIITIENIIMISSILRFCVFAVNTAFSKVSIFKSFRFQRAFPKFSVFRSERCEHKAKTDPFYPFSYEYGAVLTERCEMLGKLRRLSLYFKELRKKD